MCVCLCIYVLWCIFYMMISPHHSYRLRLAANYYASLSLYTYIYTY